MKFGMIYSLNQNRLEEEGEMRLVFYGRCRVDSLGKSFLVALSLNKATRKGEMVDFAELKRVRNSREIPIWMDFNFLYFFDLKQLLNEKNPEPVLPYKFQIDLSECGEINLINGPHLAVSIQMKKHVSIISFDHVLETNRFFEMTRKAQINQKELMKAGQRHLLVNLDFCMEYKGKLKILREIFRNIFIEMYKNVYIEGQMLKIFSEKFDKILFGFACSSTIESQYLAIFLEQFQNFFFQLVKDRFQQVCEQSPDLNGLFALSQQCKLHEQKMDFWGITDKRISNFRKVKTNSRSLKM